MKILAVLGAISLQVLVLSQSPEDVFLNRTSQTEVKSVLQDVPEEARASGATIAVLGTESIFP